MLRAFLFFTERESLLSGAERKTKKQCRAAARAFNLQCWKEEDQERSE
jgi:hypothetical protein